MILAFAVLTNTSLAAAEDAPDNAATMYRQALETIPATQADEAFFYPWATPPLDQSAVKILRKCEPSFACLQQGAALKECEWNIDYSQGLELQFPGLAKSRVLSEAAGMKVRYLCEQKRYAAAVDLACDLMVFARHMTRQKVVIAWVTSDGVENLAIEVVSRYLPEFPPETVKRLSERLSQMPAAADLRTVFASEVKMVAITIRKGPANLFGQPTNLPTDPATRGTGAKGGSHWIRRGARPFSVRE